MFYVRTWPEEQITKKQKRLFNLVGRSLAKILTLGCRVYTYGLENRVERGANEIICTHGIEERDVAKIILDWTKKQPTRSNETEVRDGRRHVFFAANHDLYSIDDFVKMGEKLVKTRWGPNGMDYKILGLIRRGKLIKPLAKIVSTNLGDAGCIPIDIRGGDNSQAKEMIKDYLLRQRAVALIQYYPKGKHRSETPLFRIKPGGLLIPHQLYVESGFDVPITVMIIKRSRDDLISNIGAPNYISEFYVPGNREKTISDAQAFLQDKQVKLYNQY